MYVNKTKALRSEISLDEIIKEARSLELSDKNVSEIEQSSNGNNKSNTYAIRQKQNQSIVNNDSPPTLTVS